MLVVKLYSSWVFLICFEFKILKVENYNCCLVLKNYNLMIVCLLVSSLLLIIIVVIGFFLDIIVVISNIIYDLVFWFLCVKLNVFCLFKFCSVF